MNFFEHQDRARAASRRLYVLYTIALIAVLVTLNTVAVVVFGVANGARSASDLAGFVAVIVCTTLITLAIIGIATIFKQSQIGGDGARVAELLGGRPITSTPTDLDERKLLNVVEEMSIASGVPMPRIYLLDHEEAINAFAAGTRSEAAVLGITRGSIQNLTRDELQGVVAHEFSHILNGDMRLNLRLISLNFGLMALGYIGLQCFRFMPNSRGGGRSSSSDRKNDSGVGILLAILAIALAMMILGYVGSFFGKMLQAAVSRQREFLADASAVQFTRNPRGIGLALRKIGGLSAGSALATPHAGEASHLFFADGVVGFLDSLFATHPPLADRIRAIDPTLLNETFVAPSERASTPAMAGAMGFAGASSPPPLPRRSADARVAVAPAELMSGDRAMTSAQVADASQLLADLPAALVAAARDPYEARALALALLLDSDESLRDQQLAAIARVDAPMLGLVQRLWPSIASIGADARLPLLDLTLPALRHLSPTQLGDFRALCRVLAETDRRLSPFEMAMSAIIDHELGAVADQSAARGGVASVSGASSEIAVVLSVLANAGGRQQAPAAFAAGIARLKLSTEPALSDGYDAEQFAAALATLRDGSPAVRQRAVEAAAHCVAADGTVRVAELELMRAVSAVLKVSLPPMLRPA